MKEISSLFMKYLTWKITYLTLLLFTRSSGFAQKSLCITCMLVLKYNWYTAGNIRTSCLIKLS